MAGLLYYLPGFKVAGGAAEQAEAVRSAGLGHAFGPGDELTIWPVQRGPEDGPAGAIVGLATPGGRVGYYPHEQTWRRIPGGQNFVGCWTSNRPTPVELARPNLLAGRGVTLGDGQTWQAPIVFAAAEAEPDGEVVQRLKLPRQIDLDEEGRFVGSAAVPQYKPALEAATWWFARVLAASAEDGGPAELTYEDLLGYALALLATNYRLGRAEVVLLGLLDEQSAQQVLDVAIDAAGFVALLKKKAGSAGSCTSAGPADETRITARPSPT